MTVPGLIGRSFRSFLEGSERGAGHQIGQPFTIVAASALPVDGDTSFLAVSGDHGRLNQRGDDGPDRSALTSMSIQLLVESPGR